LSVEEKETLRKLRMLSGTKKEAEEIFLNSLLRRSFISLGQIAFIYIQKKTDVYMDYIHNQEYGYTKDGKKRYFYEYELFEQILGAIEKGVLDDMIFDLIQRGKEMMNCPVHELYTKEYMIDYINQAKSKPQKPRPQSRKVTPRESKTKGTKEVSPAESNLYQSQLSTDGNTLNTIDALARILAIGSVKHGSHLHDTAGLDNEEPIHQSELEEKVSEEIEESESFRKDETNPVENIEDSGNNEPETNTETNISK
jgi:hypothetical protein